MRNLTASSLVNVHPRSPFTVGRLLGWTAAVAVLTALFWSAYSLVQLAVAIFVKYVYTLNYGG